MLANIRIILTEPSHPGNIGSTARAMKTMGLSQLVLVNPKEFPSGMATALASGATDVLDNAIVVDSLESALEGCKLTIATFGRYQSFAWPHLSAREAGTKIIDYLKTTDNASQVALIFGRERIGLTNEEAQLAHYHVSIPTSSEYASLNLAQAVQVIVYECFMAACDNDQKPVVTHAESEDLAPQEDLQRLYDHLETALLHCGFLNPRAPRKLMPRLKRLFAKSQLEPMETNILRGICDTICRGEFLYSYKKEK